MGCIIQKDTRFSFSPLPKSMGAIDTQFQMAIVCARRSSVHQLQLISYLNYAHYHANCTAATTSLASPHTR